MDLSAFLLPELAPGLLPVFILLSLQVFLGGMDNLLHHELTEALPTKPSARRELGLHGAREILYAVIFATLALARPEGLWALALASILAAEIAITLADFVEEDRTRVLPPIERILHTIMALMYGAILALLAPVLWTWAQAPTALMVETRGVWTLVLLIAAVGVGLWGIRDLYAFATLREPPRRATPPSGHTVLVTGATGFLGRDVVAQLLERGDTVIALTRHRLKAERLLGPDVEPVTSLEDIDPARPIHAIINLAGANVAAGPWTAKRREVLLGSRLKTTRAVTDLIERQGLRPRVLVNASAVGIYGDGGEDPLDETVRPPRGVFTAELCKSWEVAAKRAESFDVRTVMLRFGLVFGRDGGAFPSLVMTRALGVVARFGRGRQWMAWIHKTDAVGLILHALETDLLRGPVNAVAPGAARHGEVIARLAGRRLIVTVPSWLLRATLGEMSELFLASQRVRARKALQAGYSFAYPGLREALSDLTGPVRPTPPAKHVRSS